MAMELVVRVEAGDIVVLGIDGLLDNMYPTMMEEILKRETKGQAGSVCLKKVAQQGMRCTTRLTSLHSLHSLKLQKKAGLNHMGGKVDDITTVVGIISF